MDLTQLKKKTIKEEEEVKPKKKGMFNKVRRAARSEIY